MKLTRLADMTQIIDHRLGGQLIIIRYLHSTLYNLHCLVVYILLCLVATLHYLNQPRTAGSIETQMVDLVCDYWLELIYECA